MAKGFDSNSKANRQPDLVVMDQIFGYTSVPLAVVDFDTDSKAAKHFVILDGYPGKAANHTTQNRISESCANFASHPRQPPPWKGLSSGEKMVPMGNPVSTE